MDTKKPHGGLISFEPTYRLNSWGFIAKTWNNRVYPPFYHPERINALMTEWEPNENDIFICTHQKVGTHLTKKYVVELMRHFSLHPPGHGIYMGDIGHGTVPWPEVSISQYGRDAFQETLNRNKDVPRLWYTHCSIDDLPFKVHQNKAKIIHVYRDPRGAVVSQFHFYKYHPMLGVSEDLDMDSFIDLFLNGDLYFGDYFEHTKRWINEGGNLLGNENVISVRYEDLVDNKVDSIMQLAGFLFPTRTLNREDAAQIVLSTEFDTMKKEITNNPQTFHFNVDKFFREGKSMGWQDSLTLEQQGKINAVARTRWHDLKTNYSFE